MIVLARLRQAWVWLRWLVPLVLAAAAVVIWRLLVYRPKQAPTVDIPSAAVRAVADKLAAANAEAAVAVAVARTQETAVAQELNDIRTDPDTKARLARLVDLRKRVEAANQ